VLTIELIKEILEDKNGSSYGIITIGRFMEEGDRDKAYDRYFISVNRKGIRSKEE
jgi:hypothetical protein